MNTADLLIIGAGATGLMAARTLAKAGKSIIVLEARERCGGRIHTLNKELFFKQAELGAEFIHGNLPLTLNLLKEAGISVYPATEEMWHYENGRFKTDDDGMPDWGLLMKKLTQLKEDCSISSFLQHEFDGNEFAALRKAVLQFAAGYDTANPDDASSFALRNEWQHEDEEAQHRIKGGYGAMINYLADECRQAGGQIYLNSIVKDIYHQPEKVEVITTGGTVYKAKNVLIALPLGVLKADDIVFHPKIHEHHKAIQQMGFGAIIKILLEFTDAFWENKQIEKLTGRDPKQMGFILSDQVIPTWWTQFPQRSPVLTGWLGGPAAAQRQHLSEDELLDLALRSLANIFKLEPDELKNRLVAFNCANWTNDPFTRGSYAYDTVAAPEARKVLTNPINNTLFFAGEYLYEGTAMGTVEAALTSGNEVAQKILKL